MWMLRSLLVLVLLVPCVSALPSRVPDARRSASLEPVAAGTVPQFRHAHQAPRRRQAADELPASARSGYLDRDRGANAAARRAQRGGAGGYGISQAVVGKSRLRRDDVFPTVVAVDSATADAPAEEDGRTLTIVFEETNGTESAMTVAAPPTKRWGQTATYLPTHNLVLVVGGQTTLAGEITNDVYALDVADMSAASLASNSTAQSWQRLSSDGLPAHAYAAASAAVDPADGTEKLWILGGITQDCATDAPAYVWSAPVGNATAGTWAAVHSDNGVIPARRRGAKAATLASANSTSIMVSGGYFDATTCASSNGTYMGVDMWSYSSSSVHSNSAIETAHVGIDMTGTAYASIQSLALDSRMRDFSLTDYTTVVLPANGTCGEKVLFLGGKDQTGSMAPLNKFWALDVASGDWEHWNATGLIPSGRMGHTAVVTPDGKVILHGGYLQDPTLFTTNNDPISEVFILDPRQTPARWDAAVWTSASSRPPALAYHSAVMADQIMMVSFGKVNDGPVGSYAGQSFLNSGSASGGAAGQVHYLDTATMQNAGGLTWSTSTAGVAQARQAVAASIGAAPAGSASAPASAASPVQAPSAPASASASAASESPSVESKPDVAAPTPSSSPAEASPNTDNSQTTPPATRGSNHTGAIAGSLLGAAAVAAAIGGIYAYRKRKEADAYNKGRQDAGQRTADSSFPHDEEKYAGAHAPYVSNLLRSDEAGAPLAGGWGARLKRAASTLTKPHSAGAGDKYTAAPQPVVTMRSTAPRAAAMQSNAELPDDFITSVVGADDETPYSLGRGDLVLPTPHTDEALRGGESKLFALHANTSRVSLATVSSLGSGSAAAASHFSYPYLAGMHRGASPRSDHGVQRVRVILGTPESAYDHVHMSPGDIVSPFHLPHNPHASPESLFLDFHKDHDEDDEDLDTNVAEKGASVAPAANVVGAEARTPMFPWSTPVIATPPPARISAGTTARGVSMLRAKPTSLHVTNDI
ncbi:hypothetical protein EX895_004821 [Sporisorium graminicola]|uniref:Galactose oxidase n=1 Tax=Sporisorium graminicola TaxID=280036 RepID=A0A4U7KPV2_9BASI|nr:hypothetical protein EX895_004821 [Sporisorium graminicola]TKY85996.1 hypothetical protein EX895_004821 [Sporisorium graminicola]